MLDVHNSQRNTVHILNERACISKCSKLTNITIAEELKMSYLRLYWLEKLEVLPPLNCETVELDNLVIKQLPKIKADNLSISNLPFIEKIDLSDLSDNAYISIYNCKKLKALSILNNIESFCINRTALTKLPVLQSGLVQLSVRHTPITELEYLPEGLESLIIENVPLTELPPLPEGVQRVIIKGVDFDVKNIKIPKSVRILDLGFSMDGYANLKNNLPEGCRVCVGVGKNMQVHTFTCGELIY